MEEELTQGTIPAADVLKSAKGLKEAIVIGTDAKGEFYFASSVPDAQAQSLLAEAVASFGGAEPELDPAAVGMDELF